MNSPTLSVHATMQGVILGTAAYMAPEQARGKTVATRVFEDSLGDRVRSFDMAADGRLIGVVDSVRTSTGVAAPPQINVVLNWTEELKARMPAK